MLIISVMICASCGPATGPQHTNQCQTLIPTKVCQIINPCQQDVSLPKLRGSLARINKKMSYRSKAHLAFLNFLHACLKGAGNLRRLCINDTSKYPALENVIH